MVAATALVAEGPHSSVRHWRWPRWHSVIRFAGAATLAVNDQCGVALLADAPPMSTALAGVAAAAYLVLRYSSSVESVVTAPTALVRWLFGHRLGATVIPVSVPWLPLAAPVAVW